MSLRGSMESTSTVEPASIIRRVALKLLEHATDPHLSAADVLKAAEQTVKVAQVELEEADALANRN